MTTCARIFGRDSLLAASVEQSGPDTPGRARIACHLLSPEGQATARAERHAGSL